MAYWVVRCHVPHSQTWIAWVLVASIWGNCFRASWNKTANCLAKLYYIVCPHRRFLPLAWIPGSGLVFSFLPAKISLELLWGWHILSKFSLQVGHGMRKECYWCLLGWFLECVYISRLPNQEMCLFYTLHYLSLFFPIWTSLKIKELIKMMSTNPMTFLIPPIAPEL